MPENVCWTLRGQPVREHDDLYVHDQPRQGPTVKHGWKHSPNRFFFHYCLLTNVLTV